jgi:DNA-binding beta-propeller fold protein YncE
VVPHERRKAVSQKRLAFLVSAITLLALGSLGPRTARAATYGYLAQWGTFGTGDGQFNRPAYMTLDGSGNVYVVDQENHRIQKFTSNGTFLTRWGAFGTGDGQFMYPTGVAVDATGNVYVVDLDNNRVQKFTGNGVYLTQWGGLGSGPGQFNDPIDAAVDAAGNVYVTDGANGRIQKFTSNGTYLTSWGTWGSGNGQLMYPLGITLDASGNIYVVDNWNHRIQKFSSAGAYLTQWGSLGAGNGQFHYPAGIALDAIGNVYVADHANNRVQKFDGNGAYLTQWGSYGTGDGQFDLSYGIAVDASGSVYVTDLLNHRVQRFLRLPAITSVADLGTDQGGQVRVRFSSASLDFTPSPAPIVGYNVFRRIDPPLMTGGSTAEADAVEHAARPDPNGVLLAGWDWVTSVPAFCDAEYNVVVPTLADSNLTGMHWSVFLIRAATAAPGVYYDSPPDSGYSVDNLPPVPPQPFTGAYVVEATHLHWGQNREPDLWYYRIYRGNSADFVPGPGNFISAQSDTGYVDPGPAGRYYKLSAVDVNGNESLFALLTPSGTVDVPAGENLGFALGAVHPNPARGDHVTVEFVLARPDQARLELLDVAGRCVIGREVGTLGAGQHKIKLAAGGRLSPGLYFVKLTQGDRSASARVVILVP